MCVCLKMTLEDDPGAVGMFWRQRRCPVSSAALSTWLLVARRNEVLRGKACVLVHFTSEQAQSLSRFAQLTPDSRF